uniref:Uncharacterized protein n=1 Tax=Rhizophora mucronata TaxID=61149 RepID=A0A2P2PK59_RHIMU
MGNFLSYMTPITLIYFSHPVLVL